MCGFVALIDTGAQANWTRAQSALASISHRGPDAEALLGITLTGEVIHHPTNDTRIILGFRRLSILDLATRSDQPMRCERTGNLMVFNGEIYNFIELRAELEQLGHPFHTEGDSEVVLAAFAHWGEAAFARFNGMWAILIVEAATGDIVACRDRMGVKPLYFASNGREQVFASEVRAVLKAMAMRPTVNPTMVFDFLAGIELDHTDETMFEGIVSVPAGGIWRLDRRGMLQRRRYHDWDTQTISTAHPDEAHAQLRDLLTDAVRLRLRSDAPTVSLLSGGLDSSLITWLAATSGKNDPRTQFRGAFSYGYDDARYAAHDEIDRARALIAAMPEPVAHTIVRLSPIPTLDELLAMTVTQEQPSTTPSIIASWRLYQRIRMEGFKVVISGEGADELFAGYTRRYMPMLVRDQLAAGNIAGAVRIVMTSPHVDVLGVLRLLSWNLPEAVIIRLLARYRPNITTIAPAFWQSQRHRFSNLVAYHRLSLREKLAQGISHIDMPQILHYSDRNSMHASVEARLPFMDYRLVQYALSLPTTQKITAAGGKQILRHAFEGMLPASVLAQPKTHGFGNAEQHLVLEMPLQELFARAPAEAWNYIDRGALMREMQRGQAHPLVWLPISFLLWMTAWHEATV